MKEELEIEYKKVQEKLEELNLKKIEVEKKLQSLIHSIHNLNVHGKNILGVLNFLNEEEWK